jgi:alpha-beta hydrolase superfamily lysophospholipase
VAAWFAARGMAFFGADQRGHGQTPGRRGHVERFAQYLADLAALRKLVAAEAPGPQLLLGHSYGGFIVLRYLETAPQGLAGACLLAPFVDLYRPPAPWKVTMARLLADVLPAFPIATGLEYQAISRDAEVVKLFHDDPLCHELMTPRAYREMVANLPVLQAERGRIAVPLLFALAGEDRIVSTPAAEAFARALPGDVTIRHYPGMYHNVLHEPDQGRVFADLDPWLGRVMAGRAAA